MHRNKLDNTKIEPALQILLTGFEDYLNSFATITQRAYRRFELCDWHGMRLDTVERLDLYAKMVSETQEQLHRCLGEDLHQHAIWKAIKEYFVERIQKRNDGELACTFYNSVHRKIFGPAGVEAQLTFVEPCPPEPAALQTMPPLLNFTTDRITTETVRTLLNRYPFRSEFANLDDDARRCFVMITEHLKRHRANRNITVQIEMLKSPFFRGMSAYLIGRLHFGDRSCPLVFAIDNDSHGMQVDAVLLNTAQVRILFSFSRAYFHVETASPNRLVRFLKQLIPDKRTAELYIGLGFHKHGKTELYRDLLNHQKVCSQERFDFSPGQRGMVMITFNMPGDDLIYKVIRDRFDSPKKTTAKRVMDKYEYVFKHDRAGRLLDVQTFENLELEDCCFTPTLLSEIDSEATSAAGIGDSRVTLYHAYVERRVSPLDIYLKSADPASARNVVIDYGQAIKDLAQVNVFPGDMLIKNFGVTSLGRVVFYDYDELCPLTECNFRRLPQARDYEDELSSEPWFMVGEHDVFPEEFASFLGLSPELRQIFLKYHGDLLEPEFWQKTQAEIRAGSWTHIRPYSNRHRLRPAQQSPTQHSTDR